MLNKELCQKCWDSTYPPYIGYHGLNKEDVTWKFEETIYCPDEYLGAEEKWFRHITHNPPTNCPFMLEYILNEED